jgi:hypothetical protein
MAELFRFAYGVVKDCIELLTSSLLPLESIDSTV